MSEKLTSISEEFKERLADELAEEISPWDPGSLEEIFEQALEDMTERIKPEEETKTKMSDLEDGLRKGLQGPDLDEWL
jgi:hypothetical protein